MRLIGRRPGLVIPIGLVAVAVVAFTLLQRPVAAELRSADPASGTTLDSAPDRVRLTFSAPLTQAHLTVSGAETSEASAIDGKSVTQPVRAVATGAHTVSYHVVLRGGSVLTGTFDFSVRAAPPRS
jgi:copper resistance protein C